MEIKQLECRLWYLAGKLDEARRVLTEADKELKEQSKNKDKKDATQTKTTKSRC